jgi:hypothetical protein
MRPICPPASFMRWRTLSSSEPEPQAKSSTLPSDRRGPDDGSWLSSVTMAERMLEMRCGV